MQVTACAIVKRNNHCAEITVKITWDRQRQGMRRSDSRWIRMIAVLSNQLRHSEFTKQRNQLSFRQSAIGNQEAQRCLLAMIERCVWLWRSYVQCRYTQYFDYVTMEAFVCIHTMWTIHPLWRGQSTAELARDNNFWGYYLQFNTFISVHPIRNAGPAIKRRLRQ